VTEEQITSITETRELPASSRLSTVLNYERLELMCHVLMWQRTIRYGAALLLAVCAIIAQRSRDLPLSWFPIALAAGIYMLFTALVTQYLRRTATAALWRGLPIITVVADIAMIVVLTYFSSPPGQYHRIFLVGYLIFNFSVFYFGWPLGVVAIVLTLASYLVMSLSVVPYISGPAPSIAMVAINSALYLFVSSIFVLTFGNYRERMNRLRSGIKRAQAGDFGGTYQDADDKRPDELTMLGRSFNEMRDRLSEEIGTDPLTGCLNRRAMQRLLTREWRSAKRRGATIALLAIDLDKLKEINDTHGHDAGDLVLHELGAIMLRGARDTDAVARMGGDEFLVLLPDTGWQGAMTLAERLRREIDDRVFEHGALKLQVTVSIGVSLARGTDPVEPEQLMKEADRSLYRAKSEGRNRICA
jgi:diguanylate cyclase (GGDEF)-like protein